jgi:hypothetical protein
MKEGSDLKIFPRVGSRPELAELFAREGVRPGMAKYLQE